jgi:quinohemoprotein ethanol dehydrogenase
VRDRFHACAASLAACLTLVACGSGPAMPTLPKAAAVDAARIEAADREPGNWLSYGRTYDEQRFSPLKQVDASNVKDLGLAWSFDLLTAHRGQESTPLVIDGVMYVTGAWSKVFALDARSGTLKWQFDPKVPGRAAVNACCDVVNRGVAAWQGRVYVGTLDGRLVALDASSGQPVWEVSTLAPASRATITGAPRVVKGKVLIGNAGAEMGVRGYLSAYDADTGKLVWRFYTVPGDPSKGFETPALEKAAKTWSGEWWKFGGGGPVWDSIVYDSKLDLIYFGTGNGTPWAHGKESAAGTDELYLASIIAVKADTGEYVWHYQTTPRDQWDYDADSPLMLADLSLGGKTRAVIMQAPKNGFFYVLDRATGELLAADPYTATNWAKSVDMSSGRPVVEAAANYGATGVPFVAMPGPGGGHSWQPMAYSPLTKLVYLPVMEASFPYIPEAAPKRRELGWNTGVDFNAGSLPQDPKVKAQIKAGLKGHLSAWDPVTRKQAWSADLGQPWNGGVVATAGNLVFQGNSNGELVAYRADTGERLWSAPTQAAVLAAPISYQVEGEQYVAVEVGWGGAFGLASGELARDSHIASNLPRVLAFKLNGTATLPPLPAAPPPVLDPPPDKATASTLVHGKLLYHSYCSTCHGDSATGSGVLPDLRFSSALKDAGLWNQTVIEGLREPNGMISFKQELSPLDSDQIRAYVIHRATEDKKLEAAAAKAH